MTYIKSAANEEALLRRRQRDAP